MKIRHHKIITIFLVVVCFTSCDSKRVYDSYVSVSNQSWEKENTISFSFTINDTIKQRDLFINIRNNNTYAFSNLFLITQLNFPNGKKIVDTLEYEMTDVSGRFLGAGFTEIKENKLFYKENVVFPNSGDYKVSVSQAMRKNGETEGLKALEGITEVGFRIENN
ncbi:MAG: gliding motility-associated lipoprotein GldH [Polaribacter sp.]|jgi:gliding motility-associated lipoprotein GldH